MKKFVFLLFVLPALAQSGHRYPAIDVVAVQPTGTCSVANALEQYSGNGHIYTCTGGVWVDSGSGGTGSPTGAAGGDLGGTYPNPSVSQVNGAQPPASAPVAGTNSSRQVVASTGHSLAQILSCNDTSSSGSAQSCTTSPSFTPAAGDCVNYTTTTANTGTSLTLNVNSLGAKPVAKYQGSTTLAAGDVKANGAPVRACYDGTNWNLDVIANAPAGGGTPTGSAGGDLSGTYPNPSVAQVNGAAPPASAPLAGTNSSRQVVSSTGHSVAQVLACADSSGSATAQSCNTSPSFTPASGDCVNYTTTTANSGASLTLNVNSLGAKPVAKLQGYTALSPGDVKANAAPVRACYDGTNWDVDVVGTSLSDDMLSFSKPQGTIAYAKGEWVTLAASATQNLINYSGGDGYISELLIAIQSTDSAARGSSTINIYYNGEGSPTISLPVNQFFGAVYTGTDTQATHTLSSKYITANGGLSSNEAGYVMRIPIPFTGGIKIDLVNGSSSAAINPLWWTIKYHTGVPNTRPYEQRLRVGTYFSGSTGCTINSEVSLVDASTLGKRGRMIGTSLLVDAFPNSTSPRLAPLEGNVRIYLDGSGTQSYESSGTEDYFGMPFYGMGFQTENQGFNGLYGSGFWSNIGTANNTYSFYRFHELDPIVFNSGLKVTWHCGDTTQNSFTGKPVVYGTVWYYSEN